MFGRSIVGLVVKPSTDHRLRDLREQLVIQDRMSDFQRVMAAGGAGRWRRTDYAYRARIGQARTKAA